MDAAKGGAFAAHLRRFRQAAALSQEELAERARLSAKAVGALERGERRRPYPNTVRALAEALNLDEDDHRALVDAARGTATLPAVSGSEDAEGHPPVSPAPTPILGREKELAEVSALLLSGGTRLVTLTGPGGVGKTRLAQELIGVLRVGGDSHVAMVPLASVLSADLVLPTVARSIGLRTATGHLPTAIAEFLGTRSCVVVLDNLEHLLEVTPEIADLLDRCPGLVVLATSRAPLRIRAEREYPLPLLRLPDTADITDVARSTAAQLFADRVRAVVPDFEIDHRNASAVAAICRKLDGLPLALELVASHLRYLSPEQLLSRLDEALSSARLRDLPARQRTIGATLAWSYNLLTEPEKRLLRSLSVFPGAFDLDALESITGTSSTMALAGLVDQSLVITANSRGTDSVPQFRLLEPVRRYAAALVGPDDAQLAERHARYYAELGRDARAGLRGPDQGAWLERLERTHANLRLALRTMIDSGDLSAAATMGSDTWPYWAIRGHPGEGIRWWDEIAGKALDRHAVAAAQTTLAGLRLATGEIDTSRELSAAAVAGARETGDSELAAEALTLEALATIFSGDVADADARVRELLPLVNALNDPWLTAHARTAEAQLLLLRGEVQASLSVLATAEHIARESTLPFTLATILNLQATLALRTGDDDSALRALTESTRLAIEVQTTWTLVYSLPALAGVATRAGDPLLAVELFAIGAAMGAATQLAASFTPDADAAEAALSTLRRQLPEDAFRSAWTRGERLPVSEVLDRLPRISAHGAPG